MKNYPTNQAVCSAFAAYKTSLASASFHAEFSTYYRLGEYESGPTVQVTAADMHFALQPAKVEGRNFWLINWVIPEATNLPGHDGSWRLLFFGVEGIPAGFVGNTEAAEWLISHTS